MYEIIIYVYVFVIGIVIGSFLNVCIYRLPNDESVVHPSSACPKCKTKLKPLDLVPIFSYIFLRGRCRYCKEKISPEYALVEFLTGVVYVFLYYRFGWTVDFLASVFLSTIFIPVFFIDLKHMIIPDQLSIVGIIGGILLTIYSIFFKFDFYNDPNSYMNDWWSHILGMVTGTGIILIIAVVGNIIFKTDSAMGGGDLKLFAPIGLFLGFKLTLIALYFSVILGGIASIIVLLIKRQARQHIPFGPFIVIGSFLAMVYGWNIVYFWLNINK